MDDQAWAEGQDGQQEESWSLGAGTVGKRRDIFTYILLHGGPGKMSLKKVELSMTPDENL